MIGTIEDGMLRISLPTDLQVDRSTGETRASVSGVFLKVLMDEDTKDEGSATGFAITSTGKVVTNYHVVQDAEKVYVRGVNGDFEKKIEASVLLSDKNNDLAVLQLSEGSFNEEPLPFEIRPTSLEVGAKVFIIGFPIVDVMGREPKLTDGLVSSRTGYEGDISSYQVSVPIQPGNSGSPVFDDNGNIVGVANAGIPFLDNVSYAIKSSYLLNFLKESGISVLPAKSPSVLKNLSVPEKVKVLRKYIYIVEVEK